MTKRNILSVLFAGLLAGSCSGPEVRLENINPYAVPQISIEEEALADLPDLFAPPLHLLNDTLLCLLNSQDASSIRIFQTTSKEMNQYTLKKKDTAIVISPDKNLQARLEYLNPANNVYYELAVDRGEMSIADFTRLRLGKFSPSEAFKVGDKLFVGLGPYLKGLLSVFDKDKQSKEINFFGNYPVAGTEYQYQEYLDYFQGYLARRDNQFIYASTYFGYIASYSYENERLTKQWEKQTSDFLYQRVNNRIEFDSLHHEGFGCITAGKEHIYAFSQYLSEKQMKENGILVFDKSGKLLSCLRIKNPVVYLVTDSREENLYAVSYDIEEQHLYLSKLKTTL